MRYLFNKKSLYFFINTIILTFTVLVFIILILKFFILNSLVLTFLNIFYFESIEISFNFEDFFFPILNFKYSTSNTINIQDYNLLLDSYFSSISNKNYNDFYFLQEYFKERLNIIDEINIFTDLKIDNYTSILEKNFKIIINIGTRTFTICFFKNNMLYIIYNIGYYCIYNSIFILILLLFIFSIIFYFFECLLELSLDILYNIQIKIQLISSVFQIILIIILIHNLNFFFENYDTVINNFVYWYNINTNTKLFFLGNENNSLNFF